MTILLEAKYERTDNIYITFKIQIWVQSIQVASSM